MRTLSRITVIVVVFLVLFFGWTPGTLCQSTQEKETKVDATADTTKARQQPVQTPYNEQILETIRIEAVVEKPRVTLIPKRHETDIGEVKLEPRSFEKELKAKPGILSEYGKDLESGKKVKKVKKLLDKENK
jgi:hypothetical protein